MWVVGRDGGEMGGRGKTAHHAVAVAGHLGGHLSTLVRTARGPGLLLPLLTALRGEGGVPYKAREAHLAAGRCGEIRADTGRGEDIWEIWRDWGDEIDLGEIWEVWEDAGRHSGAHAVASRVA